MVLKDFHGPRWRPLFFFTLAHILTLPEFLFHFHPWHTISPNLVLHSAVNSVGPEVIFIFLSPPPPKVSTQQSTGHRVGTQWKQLSIELTNTGPGHEASWPSRVTYWVYVLGQAIFPILGRGLLICTMRNLDHMILKGPPVWSTGFEGLIHFYTPEPSLLPANKYWLIDETAPRFHGTSSDASITLGFNLVTVAVPTWQANHQSLWKINLFKKLVAWHPERRSKASVNAFFIGH